MKLARLVILLPKLLILLLCGAGLLAACGKKPEMVDPPPGQPAAQRVYPDPGTLQE